MSHRLFVKLSITLHMQAEKVIITETIWKQYDLEEVQRKKCSSAAAAVLLSGTV